MGIELDGDHHFSTGGFELDQEKEKYLAIHGIRILRFENDEVFQATEAILEAINKEFHSNTS